MRATVSAGLRVAAVGALLAAWSGCGGSNAPSSPSVNTPAVTGVQVSVGGNASSELLPGDTRQLSAAAVSSDGTRIDVTSVAEWKSSNSAAATVSSTGVVTAVSEGGADVSATHKGAAGTIHFDVRRCTLTLTPPAVTVDAFGGSQTLLVATSPGGCKWTARSSASWLSVAGDTPIQGSGPLSYAIPANSAPEARTAGIVVTTADGTTATQAVSQSRPASCSYVTKPDTLTFTAAGGTGSFDVITTPSDCRWTVSNTMSSLGVWISSYSGGNGAGRLSYVVQAHTRTVDVDGYIEIHGLSGQNPPGRHRIVVLKR
jgi:hypothetical protein